MVVPSLNSNSDDDASFVCHPKLFTKSKLKKKRKMLRIILSSSSSGDSVMPKHGELAKGSGTNITQNLDHLVRHEKLSFPGGVASFDHERDDCFKFLEETHEDQDPDWIKYEAKVATEKVNTKLSELDDRDLQERRVIDEFVQRQALEKQAQTDNSFEKYKLRLGQERTQKMARLQLEYRQKTASDLQKINDRIASLKNHHQKELQTEMQRTHQRQQHQAQQRRMLPDAAASSLEWQQLSHQIQAKQARELQEFTAKGEEIKKKTESDYTMRHEKIKNEYEQKIAEFESNRHKMVQRNHTNAQQSRDRLLKKHNHEISAQREVLVRELKDITDRVAKVIPINDADTSYDGKSHSIASQSVNEIDRNMGKYNRSSPFESVEQSPLESRSPMGLINKHATDDLIAPVPVKTYPSWIVKHGVQSQLSGSSMRHKHRKAVMNQSLLQVTVEIHNEGVWVCIAGNTASGSEESENNPNGEVKANENGKGSENNETPLPAVVADNREFLAWGVKACSFLEAIICGEIPTGYDRLFQRLPKDSISWHGGQFRCVIADLRTSEETASQARASALEEHEDTIISFVNNRAVETESKLKEHESTLDSVRREVEKAKRIQDEFTTKFRNFLGPDGKPLPHANAHDSQELLKAMANYKNDFEAAKRNERTALQSVDDFRTKSKNMQELVTNTKLLKRGPAASTSIVPQHSENGGLEAISVRMKDVMGWLKKTADKRRENAKERSNVHFANSWVQSFPGVSSSVKKYLWHKMHRRKQQIILRPSYESLVNEALANVNSVVQSTWKREATGVEQCEAERLLLLALYPEANEKLPSVPTTKIPEKWAEPGWRLNLEVEKYEYDCIDSFVLPCARFSMVPESDLSEMSSTSGRQASSMLDCNHIKCLSSPLSIFATASSPAETSTFLSQNFSLCTGDPLAIDGITLAAAFQVFTTTKKVVTPMPKLMPRSEKKSPDTVPIAAQSSVPSLPVGPSQNLEKQKPEAKKRRLSATGSSAGNRARTQKKKKSDEDSETIDNASSLNQQGHPAKDPAPSQHKQVDEKKQSQQHIQQQQSQQQQSQQQQSQQQQSQQQQSQQQQSNQQQLRQKPQLSQLQQQQVVTQQSKQQQIQHEQQQHAKLTLAQRQAASHTLQQQMQQRQLQQQQQGGQATLQQNYQNLAQTSQPTQQDRLPFQQPQQQARLHQQQLQPMQSQQQQHTQYPGSRNAQQYAHNFQSQARQQMLQQQQAPQPPQQVPAQQHQRFSSSQIAQFRMMQQQGQSPNNSGNRQLQQQPREYSQQQQHALQQQMSQFYGTPLNHPNNSAMGYMQSQPRQGFSGQQQIDGIPGGNPVGQHQQQQQQQQQQQGNQTNGNDQNDPLFLLK